MHIGQFEQLFVKNPHPSSDPLSLSSGTRSIKHKIRSQVITLLIGPWTKDVTVK